MHDFRLRYTVISGDVELQIHRRAHVVRFLERATTYDKRVQNRFETSLTPPVRRELSQ